MENRREVYKTKVYENGSLSKTNYFFEWVNEENNIDVQERDDSVKGLARTIVIGGFSRPRRTVEGVEINNSKRETVEFELDGECTYLSEGLSKQEFSALTIEMSREVSAISKEREHQVTPVPTQ